MKMPRSDIAAWVLMAGFTSLEWKRLAAMAVFFVFAAIFWGAYEQAGSTLNLFGDRYTRTTILGFNFPSSWFVSGTSEKRKPPNANTTPPKRDASGPSCRRSSRNRVIPTPATKR